MNFDQFFHTATGKAPYPYQGRLACGDGYTPGQANTQTTGTPCQSRLIDIPTGLGKTAAVVLAWLWNRCYPSQISNLQSEITSPAAWPRRLIYCLPMRTLVEQTAENVRTWLTELATAHPNNAELAWLAQHSPIILMGGEDLDPARRDWDIHPEKPAILIGTQDMLLSRALNRGYGMSRHRWPIHFALLNNDCLWVMDETQLMGAGIQTARQLEAFRRAAQVSHPPHGFDTFGPCHTWYCSATASEKILNTREWRQATPSNGWKLALLDPEKSHPEVARRLRTTKQISLHAAKILSNEIQAILDAHRKLVADLDRSEAPIEIPRRTLVICNTVDRATEVYENLFKACPLSAGSSPEFILLHSRFRPPERAALKAKLEATHLQQQPHGQIVVSTQVIEAGVDISCGILWTEIAPLASLVQRFGRINRAGEFGHDKSAKFKWKPCIHVTGVPLPDLKKKDGETAAQFELRKKEAAHLPYALASCEAAWPALEKLQGDASPANLATIQSEIADSIQPLPYSLLRHELLDFFDTDANLSLGFTDVSPFVRGLDHDTDVYVLWRQWEKDTEPNSHFTGYVAREELCAVPISKINALKNRHRGYLWLGKEKGWVSTHSVAPFPGCLLLLPTEAGGYSQTMGWTGSDTDKPSDLYQPPELPEDEEALSILNNGWQSIEAHTNDVAQELATILGGLAPLALPSGETEAIQDLAVPWHDIGKSLWPWRRAAYHALLKAKIPKATIKPHLPLAKFSLSDSPVLRNPDGSLKLNGLDLKREIHRLKRSFRPGVAHEVASALAFRQAEQTTVGPARDADLCSLLAEYLIMSHHGRVRKVLRDEIPRFPSQAKDTETVRGIAHGTPLPPVTINGQQLGCDSLSTDCRKMGRSADGHESYTRAVLRLLEHHGPFRLTYFEALFRAADMRASAKAATATPLSQKTSAQITQP